MAYELFSLLFPFSFLRCIRHHWLSLLRSFSSRSTISDRHSRNSCTIPPILPPKFSVRDISDFVQITKFRQGKGSPYAVITGPTSGIGKSYAFALAKAQFNLILVSRSLSKLEELRTEILAKYPKTEIKLVDIDIGAKPLSDKYADVLDEVHNQDGGDIRILVNNAGMSHSIPVTFEETAEEEMEGILAVNNAGVLRITKATLPYLLNDRKKKRLIVNVGSFAGFTPTPVHPLYGNRLMLCSYLLPIAVQKHFFQHGHMLSSQNSNPKISSFNILVPPTVPFPSFVLAKVYRV